MTSIRIVVAEDDPEFRGGLCDRLRLIPDFTIVGEARDGREAIASVGRLDPDILILDLGLPGITSLEVLQVVQWLSPKTKVIVCSGHAEAIVILESLQLGAKGHIIKDNRTDLQKAIRAVQGGEMWVKRRVLARLLEHLVGLVDPAY